jgi:hypothetical protein
MSHNNGGVTNFGKKIVSKFEKSPLNDDESDVGGLKCTPHLMKPLVSLSFESCVTSMMKPKP